MMRLLYWCFSRREFRNREAELAAGWRVRLDLSFFIPSKFAHRTRQPAANPALLRSQPPALIAPARERHGQDVLDA